MAILYASTGPFNWTRETVTDRPSHLKVFTDEYIVGTYLDTQLSS